MLVLERGKRFGHTDFRQSMDIDHLSDVYELIQGQGAQIVAANLVGGGSNLYLAASLRSPTRDLRAPRPPPGRRPVAADVAAPRSAARRSTRSTRAPSAGLRVRQPSWNQVSKSGGVWAAMLREAGHTCDRVPIAIDLERCVDAKWCYTGCIFGAKNSLITNYLRVRRARGRRGPAAASRSTRWRRRRRGPYRWMVRGDAVDPDTKQAAGAVEIECKVAILAAGRDGHAADPDALARAAPCRRSRRTSAGTSASTATTSRRSRSTRARSSDVLGLPGGYDEFYKGKPITTMSYDHWVGKRGTRARRDPLHAPGDLPLASSPTSSTTTAAAPAASRHGGARRRSGSIATWSRHIEILAMVEETMDGAFYAAPPTGGGARAAQRRADRNRARSTTTLSEQSVAGPRGGQRGDQADRRAARGSGGS